MRVYLPSFIILFIGSYYLSTIFIADREFLEVALNDGSERAKNFNALFFSYRGAKMLLSWLIKGTIIAAICFLLSGISFGSFMRVHLFSMIAYVFSNLAGFLYKIFEVPETILELRRNTFSIWSTGIVDDQSLFVQNLSWHVNPFEVLYIFLFVYGSLHLLNEKHSKTKHLLIVITIVAVDFAYILLTALF